MINKYIENIAPMTHMQIHKILDVPFEKMKQVPAFLCHLENGYNYDDLMLFYPEETKKYIAKVTKQIQNIKTVLESYLKVPLYNIYLNQIEHALIIELDKVSFISRCFVFNFYFIENEQYKNEVLTCLSKPDKILLYSFRENLKYLEQTKIYNNNNKMYYNFSFKAL